MSNEQDNSAEKIISVETPINELENNSGPLAGTTFSVASLGCPKNLVDAESTVGRLIAAGAELSTEAEAVDVFLLNTCGFLRSARDEAAESIRDALAEKAEGNLRFLLVAGCAVVSDGKELAAEFPGVDAWLSPFDLDKVVDVVRGLVVDGAEGASTKGGANNSASAEGESPAEPFAVDETVKNAATLTILTPNEVAAATSGAENGDPGGAAVGASVGGASVPARFFFNPARNLTLDDSTRRILTAPNVAYLKIADGCDRFCSYCAIPNIRGRFVSKPLDAILAEAERLAAAGVRELVLIAQETTFWGGDLYGEPRLAALLATLKEKNWFDWIRVLYTYPLFWGNDLVSLFKMEPAGTTSILPYVDVPLQHCNDRLLKAMNRRVGKAQTEELLARLREEIPDLVLRTTFIVGFPGETDAEYQELVDFVEKHRFERAGVFQFSAEPGTPAARLDGQVDPKTKALRWERLYAKQERISRRYARSWIGKTVDVTLDSRGISESGTPMRNVCLGRTRADAPDIDPIVYVTGRDLELGRLTRCEIVEAQGLDLIAVPADPEKIFVSKGERKAAAERAEMEREREANGGVLPAKPKSANPKKTPNGSTGGNGRGNGGNGRWNGDRKNDRRGGKKRR